MSMSRELPLLSTVISRPEDLPCLKMITSFDERPYTEPTLEVPEFDPVSRGCHLENPRVSGANGEREVRADRDVVGADHDDARSRASIGHADLEPGALLARGVDDGPRFADIVGRLGTVPVLRRLGLGAYEEPIAAHMVRDGLGWNDAKDPTTSVVEQDGEHLV